MRTGWVVVVCLSLVGCSQIFGLDDPQRGSGDGGVFDVIDAYVSIDAHDAGSCADLTVECASGDVLRECTMLGTSPVDTLCEWGCSAGGGGAAAHCAVLEPAGGVLVANDLAPNNALVPITIGAATQINTETGEIIGLRAAGPGVISGIEFEARNGAGVFTFRSLTMPQALEVRGDRPLAIVGLDGVTLTATLGLRGECTGNTAGPGGTMGGVSGTAGFGIGAGGGGGANNDNGGGGGGHGALGGSGGNSGAGFGGSAGTAIGDALITNLLGGAGGGAGGDTAGGASGGGGGGAVQIASNGTISIAQTGVINAGGCGGRSATGNDGGGGGGAGGTILLEAPTILVDGVLAVNGGGGGAGEGGNDGAPGAASRARAVGGGGGAGDGGDGGAAMTPTGADGSDGDNGGGGGGGVGRIRINTRTGFATLGGSAVMSPAFTDPATTATQGAASTN